MGILQATKLEWVVMPSSGELPNSGIEPRSPHFKKILYHLSHQGSPRRLECVAYTFSRKSFQPRDQPRVSCIAGGLFTSWVTREAHYLPLMTAENFSKYHQVSAGGCVRSPPVAAAAAKLLQSYLTLCDPTDGSPPGSAVPGILQARTLEWVAIFFSNEITT